MIHPILPMLVWAAAVCGHPIPDGQILRGVQCVVRSDRIEIRYQLGLNDAMVQAELKRLAEVAKEGQATPPEPIPADATEALSLYRKKIAVELPRQLEVRIDGKLMPLSAVRADLVRQHHASIECGYELAIRPTATPAKLEISDANFSDVAGEHTLAVRARGQVELFEPPPSPVLVRDPATVGESAATSRSRTTFFCLPDE